MALGFRDNAALQVVLASGLCPADVQARGAQVAENLDGTVILQPELPMTNAVLGKLRAAGVVTDATLPMDARAVRCWAEAVRLATVPTTIPSLVLLVTDRPAQLLDLAAELLRLGCERQELLVTDRLGVIRAVDPPTYTVVRALDREGGLRVYAPDPAGQDAVWTELGHHHPLAERLKADKGHLLLVTADHWRSVADIGWRGLDAALELTVPAQQRPFTGVPLGARRKVELRLATGRREAASLWVMRTGGIALIDRLLAYLPDDIVARLTFAATASEAGDPVVILRARTGRHPPPDLSLEAETYAPLASMGDLYAPAGAIVEPPLRRERLRATIGIAAGEIVWLAATEPRGRFRVERIAETAFSPLNEWAEYIIHTSVPALQPWLRGTTFDFAQFVSSGVEWAHGPAPAVEEDDADEPKKKKRGVKYRPVSEAQPHTPVSHAVESPRGPTLKGDTPVTEVLIDAELAALEAEFVALDAPGDAPERLALLERLAKAYARLGRRRDAGLCFARAVWEAPTAEVPARLDAWIAADLRGGDVKTALERTLGQTVPAGDDVRLVAAITARAPAPVTKDPHRVQRWLDDHDGDLDARSMWLARLGLARLAGGDTLGLAHARDRILGRLAGGLPVERELPAFLRFAGRTGALGNASGELLGKALDALADKVVTTRRKRSPVEAPIVNTNAYVGFQLAHGFARIGRHERARSLMAESRKALASTLDDAVHAYLVDAFTARVEQAIAGLPPETPIADAISSRLAALDRVVRYKIDRLREVSRILEPLERPDAIGAFSKRQKDSRGPEFAALRAITDPAERIREVAKLAEIAADNGEERERLIDGIFDVLLELPESGAAPILARTWPLIGELPEPRRAVLYAEALVVAGHFGRTELIPELLELLSSAIRVVAGPDLERVLDQSLRALRRIGLRAEIAELLVEAEKALPANRSDALRGRLALAAGLAYLGDSDRAQPIFEQARKALAETTKPIDRLDLTRALANAYAQMPLGHALGGITELSGHLRDVTDSYGTNSHYCLSVLHFVESLVLGITSDDLALGEAGRRFVEDDEHLIRRRLHRDLGGPS